MFKDLKFMWKCVKASRGHWSFRVDEMNEAMAGDAALSNDEAAFHQEKLADAKGTFVVCIKEFFVELGLVVAKSFFNVFVAILVCGVLLLGLMVLTNA